MNGCRLPINPTASATLAKLVSGPPTGNNTNWLFEWIFAMSSAGIATSHDHEVGVLQSVFEQSHSQFVKTASANASPWCAL